MAPGRETTKSDGRSADTAQLVADHHQAIYRYAYRLTGSSADAEDLAQQVFLVAHEHSQEVRDRDRMRAWLFAVLRSCYAKLKRRRQPLPAASVELDVNLVAADSSPDTLDDAKLQQAIDVLDDDSKIVILMFYFEYQTYRQISEQLAIPLGTVMSRLARAKAQLRSRLFEPATKDYRPVPSKSQLARAATSP